MLAKYPTILTLSERVVKCLIVVNIAYGAGILLLLTATLVSPAVTFTALVGKTSSANVDALRAMQLLMVAGFAAVPVAHVVLARLRDMLATVRSRPILPSGS